MKHGSLFSGVGGFDLAAQWMGWENVFHCEILDFQQKVLKKRFPGAQSHQDIYKLDGTIYRGLIDIISAGFPCQKYSVAGKRMGDEPLKNEMLRIFRESKPTWGVIENVYGFITPKFAEEHNNLCIEMEDMGYQVQTFDIDAASVGLSTVERHVWIVAKNNSVRHERVCNIQDPNKSQLRSVQSNYQREYDRWHTPESRVLRVGKGISRRMDRLRVGALGNAIPPQVAFEIFKAIEATTR